MIRPTDRKIALALVRLKIWRVEVGLFGCPQLVASKRTRWLYRWMRRRQAVEDRPYHHAPCCPANRWAEQALVLQRCNCGAVRLGITNERREKAGV